MDFSEYSRDQLIQASYNEYFGLCHDEPEFEPDNYLAELNAASDTDLQEEIEESIMMDNVVKGEGQEEITLQSFMATWLQ